MRGLCENGKRSNSVKILTQNTKEKKFFIVVDTPSSKIHHRSLSAALMGELLGIFLELVII